MKNRIIKLLFFFLLIMLPLNSVFGDWTIMLYMDADNDLKQYTDEIFRNIANVDMSSGDIKVLTLYDRDTPNPLPSPDYWHETRRGYINLNNDPDINWGTSMGELNMGKPETLIDFVNWGISNNPGDQYALIIFDHGSGWWKSICQEDTNGVFSVSGDSGTSWIQFDNTDGLPSIKLNCVYAQSTSYYVGTDEGIAVSLNSGTSWTTYTTANGLGSNNIQSVFAVSSSIYAGTNQGLAISLNNGTSWTNYTTSNGLAGDDIRSVHVSGSYIYAATPAGLSVSSNGGSSWTNYTTSNGLGSNDVLDVYASGSNIYAGTGGGLSVSTNAGSSWTNYTTTNGLPSNQVNSAFGSGANLYAGTDKGLSVSANSGSSWTNYTATNGLPNQYVDSVYASGSTIYASTPRGLAISTDNGSSWRAYGTAEGIGGDIINDFCVSGSNIYTVSGGFDYLSLNELEYAFNEITTENSLTLDFLGFNACLMGMAEVAYSAKDFCDYLLFSEETEYAVSWDYESLLNELVADPSMTAIEIGDSIVSHYLAKGDYLGDIALIDCSVIDDLADDIDTLATTLSSYWDSNITNCVNAAQTVLTSIDSTVLNAVSCNKNYGSHGISIYFPKISQPLLPNYTEDNISFLNDTAWDAFLGDFRSDMSGSWVEAAKNQSQTYGVWVAGAVPQVTAYTDLYDFCFNLVHNIPDALEVSAVTDFYINLPYLAYNPSAGTTYTMTNTSQNSFSYTVSASESWVQLSSQSGTLNPGTPVNIGITFTNASNIFDKGVHKCRIDFTNTGTGVVRSRDIIVNLPGRDMVAEEPTSIDFENSMVVFTPNGSGFYTVWCSEADRLPSSIDNAEELDMSSTYSIDKPLTSPNNFPFFGTTYTTLSVCKKGVIYLDDMQGEETFWPSDLTYLFARKTIGALGAALTPETAGDIYYEEMSDRAVVTFNGVASSNNANLLNTFQMELFFDGKIRFTYLTIEEPSPVIGLTNGDYFKLVQNGQSDMSSYYHIGDVDGDEDIDIVDALKTAQYANNQNPTDFHPHVADVDGDGDIDSTDATLINYYYVDLIDEFPCQYN